MNDTEKIDAKDKKTNAIAAKATSPMGRKTFGRLLNPLGCVIVGVIVLLLWNSSNRKGSKVDLISTNSKPTKSTKPAGGSAPESAGGRFNQGKRLIEPRPTDASDDLTKLNTIQTAGRLVINALREDEKARTKFIGVTETPEAKHYEFTTMPRTDLDDYVSKASSAVATKMQVSPMAVKMAIQDQLASYDIPREKRRKTSVTIPNNPEDKITFFSATPKDLPTNGGKSFSFTGRMEVGSVPLDSGDNWRFGHFLDLIRE